MKSLFKKKANPQTPRQLEEIQKEWQSLSAQAANAQYKVFVHSKELEEINERLMEVNQEANERQQLDKEVQDELKREENKSGAV